MKKVFMNSFVAIVIVLSIICLAAYTRSLSKISITAISDLHMLREIENGFVYFGRSTCPSCELFMPLLSDVANEENLTIYYFDTDYFRKEKVATEDELSRIFSEYKVRQVPILVSLLNGVVDRAYGAEFNEDESMTIKDNIREFLKYTPYPAKHIPHYYVVLLLSALSVTIMISAIVFKNKHWFSRVSIYLMYFCVGIDISLILMISPIMQYLDAYSLSWNPRYTMLIIAIGILNVVTFIGIYKCRNRSRRLCSSLTYYDSKCEDE